MPAGEMGGKLCSPWENEDHAVAMIEVPIPHRHDLPDPPRSHYTSLVNGASAAKAVVEA